MMELVNEPSYLAFHPTLIKLSLEKRVITRNEILKFLKENELVKRKLISLYSVVLCFKIKVPREICASFQGKDV